MTGCTFTGNTALSGSGGAIYSSLGGNGSGVNVTGGMFSGNQSSANGGAICSLVDGGSGAGDTVTVSSSTFTGNSASNGGADYNPVGGTFVLNGCNLSANTAATYGGAIFDSQGSAATIFGGTIEGNLSSGGGGGIYNDGTLTVTTSTLASNSSAGKGGGLFNAYGAILTIIGSAIENNTTTHHSYGGGGIWNQGTLSADGCTFDQNRATASGGALFNFADGQIDLDDCGFTDNSAGSTGGAISDSNDTGVNGGSIFGCAFSGNSVGSTGGGGIAILVGELTIANSTFAGNTSGKQGGGLFVDAGASATVTNCTVTGNSAAEGGGIDVSGATANIANTIVAGNTATTSGPDVLGSFASHGTNLIGATDGSTGWVGSDLTGTIASPLDPMLAPLANNGPILTVALLPGSPAVNAGNSSLALDAWGVPLTTDQRGPGYARFAGGVVDIGAFQVQTNVVTAATPTSVHVDGSYAGDALWTPVTLTGGTVIVIGYDAFGTVQAGIDGVAAGGTVNVAAGTYTEQLTISQSLTLAGAGIASTTISAPAGLSSDEIEIENGASVTISGLTVDGASDSTGIDVNASTLSASALVVIGYLNGISIENGSAATITDSTLSDDATAIAVGSGAPSTLTNTNVSFAGSATEFSFQSMTGDQYVLTPNSSNTSVGIMLERSPVGTISGGEAHWPSPAAAERSPSTAKPGPASTDVFTINDASVKV